MIAAGVLAYGRGDLREAVWITGQWLAFDPTDRVDPTAGVETLAAPLDGNSEVDTPNYAADCRWTRQLMDQSSTNFTRE